MKQTEFSASLKWLRTSRWAVGVLGWLLPWLALAQQPPTPQTLASYASADQARFRPGAPVAPAPAGLPAAGARVLRPGVAVFGWLPYWVPVGYAQQVDFALLSHVAYEGYQATEQGGLLPPPAGSAAGVAALVHKSNPQCRVLLSVGYQEPATGAALFGMRAGALQQALAQAVAQQVSTLQADGVNLDLSFRPQPVASAGPPRHISKAEQARDLRRLDKTRQALNLRRSSLKQDSSLLVSIKKTFATKVSQGQAVRPADQRTYDKAVQQQQRATTDFQRSLAAYRRALAANKQGLAPLANSAAPNRPAALLSFVQVLGQALRQQNPKATLTISLPAVDSARVYTQLPTLAPFAQAFVLKAFDYTAGRVGSPGPLAPLHPSTQWGTAAVATSVGYYLGQGVRPAQLLVGLPQMGKIWPEYAQPPVQPTAIAPYQYLTNQALRSQPRTSQQPDSASGSYRLQLPPGTANPAQTSPPVPRLAWADDSASLAAKYDWLLTTQQLGGIGIWALGFDAPNAPVWSLLRARLTIPAPPVAHVDTTTTQATPPAPKTDKQLLQATVQKAERLAALPLVHLLLFGLVLLLAFAWVGLLVGAGLYARQLVPYPRRLALTGGLMVAGAVLLALYVSYTWQFSREALLISWLGGLMLVAVLAIGYRTAQPAELP